MNRPRYRSLFWPAVLILFGIIALLVNIGAITPERLYELFLLWPLILIVIGLELVIRRSIRGTQGDIAAALTVLVAVAAAVLYVAAAPSPAASGRFDSSSKVASLEQAAVEIDAGSASITVTSSGDLGEDLYRAHIEYTGNRPEVSLDRTNGTLRISQNGPTFLQPQKFTLGLQLNASIHLNSLNVNTGAGREDITLGQPSGIVPVNVNSGAVTVHIHRPSGVPASVEVSGGAVSLDADSKHVRGIGVLTYESPDFAGATAGYRLRVNCGSCTVTLDSTT